jgi:nitrite reductase (NO-forming)
MHAFARTRSTGALLAVALVAVVLSTVGCAGSDGPGAEAAGEQQAPEVREAAGPGPDAGTVEVDIRMFAFEDEVVEISVGDTVTWANHDATRHTVTSGVDGEPDGAFELSFDQQGDAASLTFDEPGEYRYFCAPHPFMTGTVVVAE